MCPNSLGMSSVCWLNVFTLHHQHISWLHFYKYIMILETILFFFILEPPFRRLPDHVSMSRIAYFKRKFVDDDEASFSFRTYCQTVSIGWYFRLSWLMQLSKQHRGHDFHAQCKCNALQCALRVVMLSWAELNVALYVLCGECGCGVSRWKRKGTFQISGRMDIQAWMLAQGGFLHPVAPSQVSYFPLMGCKKNKIKIIYFFGMDGKLIRGILSVWWPLGH